MAAIPEVASCRKELGVPDGAPIPNDKKFCLMTCVGLKLGNVSKFYNYEKIFQYNFKRMQYHCIEGILKIFFKFSL